MIGIQNVTDGLTAYRVYSFRRVQLGISVRIRFSYRIPKDRSRGVAHSGSRRSCVRERSRVLQTIGRGHRCRCKGTYGSLPVPIQAGSWAIQVTELVSTSRCVAASSINLERGNCMFSTLLVCDDEGTGLVTTNPSRWWQCSRVHSVTGNAVPLSMGLGHVTLIRNPTNHVWSRPIVGFHGPVRVHASTFGRPKTCVEGNPEVERHTNGPAHSQKKR